MKQLFFLAVCVLPVFHLGAQQTIVHDPNVELRDVKGFHAIEVSDEINLYLSQGDEEKVAVSSEDIKWRDRIQTQVVDGVLKIFVRTGDQLHWGTHTKQKAYVSFKTLDRLQASGATRVSVDGTISEGSLSIHLSGASNFKGAVHVDELFLEQSGASSIVLKGSASHQASIHTSGASMVSGYGFSTDSCTVHCSGASNVHVTVNKEIEASASGSSQVHYKGEVTVEKIHSSGASKVRRAG
jgi:hypothetical protein